jgi:hypothetical protein
MSDEEEQYEGEEEEDEEEEEGAEEGDENAAPAAAAPAAPAQDEKPKSIPPESALSPSGGGGAGALSPSMKSPTPGRQYAIPEQPKSVQRREQNFSAGKPSKHDKAKLMRSEGIIPIQAGSNKYASQRGMTGFGRPR